MVARMSFLFFFYLGVEYDPDRFCEIYTYMVFQDTSKNNM